MYSIYFKELHEVNQLLLFLKEVSCVVAFTICTFPLSAQPVSKKKIAKPDRNLYISDYKNDLTLRSFGSRKYVTHGLHDKEYADQVRYQPNSPFNIGMGFNYKLIGVNIGFNLPLINDSKEFGKTNFLDIQTHVYGKKLIFDIYLQRYKGFYLSNSGVLDNNSSIGYYLRPDIATFNIGLSAQYLWDGDQFSLKAAFLQNEVQLKSAGSLILGAAIGDFIVMADSSIIPMLLNQKDYFNNSKFNRSNIKSLTANIGYGYTYILPHHFFLTGTLSGGLGINYTQLKSRRSPTLSHWGNDFTATFRIGLGYNSNRFFAGIHYVTNLSTSSTYITNARQELSAGNFRISVAHRFALKKKLFGFY
ncbi:MAG: DUF4421 domain-containing protein [Phycisphaerales bacterium]|nr:DUF4421 domain-containing protein [Phycisphaerales bacterium]